MAKLKLNPDATFQAKVAVPVPGGEADVLVTFKYRPRDALLAWVEASKEMSDAESMLDCIVGWDLDDAPNAENFKRLCNAYPGAAEEILKRYLRELTGIRKGN